MFSQRCLNGIVADNVTTDTNEIARDEMLAIEITHDITNGRSSRPQEGELFKWRGVEFPPGRAAHGESKTRLLLATRVYALDVLLHLVGMRAAVKEDLFHSCICEEL